MSTPTFFTKTQISHLKIEELKVALTQRGLDTSGNRSELQLRLRQHIHPVHGSQENLTPPNISNVGNDSVVETGSWDVIMVKQGPVFKKACPSSTSACCRPSS